MNCALSELLNLFFIEMKAHKSWNSNIYRKIVKIYHIELISNLLSIQKLYLYMLICK